MPKQTWFWICLRSLACQNFGYNEVLNMAGFSVCERYTVPWRCQNMLLQSSECTSGSKYTRICKSYTGFLIFDNIAEYGEKDVNMSEYNWIYYKKQDSKSARVLHLSHTIRSARSFYKITSTYWKMGVLSTTLSKI